MVSHAIPHTNGRETSVTSKPNRSRAEKYKSPFLALCQYWQHEYGLVISQKTKLHLMQNLPSRPKHLKEMLLIPPINIISNEKLWGDYVTDFGLNTHFVSMPVDESHGANEWYVLWHQGGKLSDETYRGKCLDVRNNNLSCSVMNPREYLFFARYMRRDGDQGLIDINLGTLLPSPRNHTNQCSQVPALRHNKDGELNYLLIDVSLPSRDFGIREVAR